MDNFGPLRIGSKAEARIKGKPGSKTLRSKIRVIKRDLNWKQNLEQKWKQNWEQN